MHYNVVIESTGKNYCARVPDLPGCVAPAATPEGMESEIREAIRFHLDGPHADGESVPDPFGAFSEWGGAIDDEDYAGL